MRLSWKRKRVKSMALKDKKESSDDETSISGSEDEEYARVVRDFKKFFRKKGRFVKQPHDEKKSFRKRNEKKGTSYRNALDADIRIILLASIWDNKWYLANPPHKFTWVEQTIPVSKAEAEAAQIILTGIDNDIYSTFDACINAYEMWKAIERLKQVNVQFLLQLQLEWQRFVTLVKQSQELKTVSYHKLYDILKQHQNKVNEIRAKRLVRTTNPLALVAQQQPIYHPTHYTQNSSTRPQQAATKNRDDALSKEKEIDKLMALISLSVKKIYKPTNNNLKTSSTPVEQIRIILQESTEELARESQKLKWAKDAAYHKEKILLCKQEEAGFQLNVEQADWRDNTNDEPEDQELEAHYLYMAQIQEVTPDATDNSRPIYDVEPEHPEQPGSVNVTYIKEHGDTNITTDPLDMSINGGEAVQDEDENLAREHDLLASLINKLKCEIDDSKNRNKILESSNKTLVDKLKGEIEDFKTKN
ncbi:hypothetical protein Tco_0639835 [Tanacetum coccineum]